MLKYLCLPLGELQTNCYLVWDEGNKDCFIIDPADDGVAISEEIQVRQLQPKGILATHGHFDHLLGAIDLKLIYKIPFFANSEDEFLLSSLNRRAGFWLKQKIIMPTLTIDQDLKNIDELGLGKEIITVMKTPGHTPGGVCFYAAKSGLLFTGDTLFAESEGRTDLSYSSDKDLHTSLAKLKKLPPEILLLPGHGEAIILGRLF